MPYFLCPRCAVRAYSAAAESSCPACGGPLHGKHQLHPSISEAEAPRPGAQPPAGGRGASLRQAASVKWREAIGR
jgi:hypothetical protein